MIPRVVLTSYVHATIVSVARSSEALTRNDRECPPRHRRPRQDIVGLRSHWHTAESSLYLDFVPGTMEARRAGRWHRSAGGHHR